MVRIKHRYLLVNIIYPDSGAQQATNHDGKLPPVVDFRRPSPSTLGAGSLVRHIRDHVELLYGDHGMGVTGSGMSIKYFSQATSTFIVRCPRAHYRLVWSALTYMTHLPKSDSKGRGRQATSLQSTDTQPCIMRVVRVSGTIRKSEEEAIRRARADILRAQKQQAANVEGGASSRLDAIFSTAKETLEMPGIEDDDMDEDENDDSET